VYYTSSTLTIRVPGELKEKMKNTKIEWSEEIRQFIETRINSIELSEAVDEVAKRAEKRTTKIDSTKLIREDRER
jgi:predicted DNA-binding protein